MNSHSKYELVSVIKLITDTREIIVRDGLKSDLFDVMNGLIIESVTRSLWRYNTPTLILATARVHDVLMNENNANQPAFLLMDKFIKNIKDLCRSVKVTPETVVNDLNRVIKDVEFDLLKR